MIFIRYFIRRPEVGLISVFVALISLGTALLSLPIAVTSGTSLNFMQALFTATSASTVTGLVTINIGTQLSLFGQIVILFLIETGALGIMTTATMFFWLAGRHLNLTHKIALRVSFELDALNKVVPLLKFVFSLFFGVQIIGILFMYLFTFTGTQSFGHELFTAIFHTGSAFGNAGFTLNPDSFAMYSRMMPVIILTTLLMFAGSIGHPALKDLLDHAKSFIKGKKRHLQLNTKIVLTFTLILFALGVVLLYIFNIVSTPKELKISFTDAIFNSMSARTTGLSTFNLEQLPHASQTILIPLMFIGGGPGSAAGGIHVTVLAVMIFAAYSHLVGKSDVEAFKYKLPLEPRLRAMTIFMFSVFAVFLGALVLQITDDLTLQYALFNSTSAFATVGYSLGNIANLSYLGQFVLIALMFIGRVGPLTILLVLFTQNKLKKVGRPTGVVLIG